MHGGRPVGPETGRERAVASCHPLIGQTPAAAAELTGARVDISGGEAAVSKERTLALRGTKYADRISDSAAAKQAMLERFKARPSFDDPAVLARAEERRAIKEARDQRAAEKERMRREDEARREAERIAAEKAEHERRELEELARIERQAELEAAQKAARDARYAARKAAKRRK